MQELFGQKLLKAGIIDETQLREAEERQRLHGGRLGQNITALGYATQEKIESFFRQYPREPKTVAETGLDMAFICDLTLKHAFYLGEFMLADLAQKTMLPVSVLDLAIEELRRSKFIEVKKAGGYATVTYIFLVTGPGRAHAEELLALCSYAGPMPVTLEHYRQTVELQTIKHIIVDEKSVHDAFAQIVISDAQLRRIGPAISSGRAIFLYGPPGNGKTTIAEAMGRVLPENVYLPYAIYVGSQIITVFDSVTHEKAASGEGDSDHLDRRWVLVRRPVVMTGGELTLRMLNLEFNPVTRFYEAPLQMKANNGLFIIDDFGRQQIEPQHLLNRWIVPLERHTDFLSLHTGMKFDIPFDQLVVFSTNLEPKQLVDEAFLRRIRYKIKIDHPTEEQYLDIFRRVCEARKIECSEQSVRYLLDHHYRSKGVTLNACHPRDLIDHIIDNAHYFRHMPVLTPEALDDAWHNYFVDM